MINQITRAILTILVDPCYTNNIANFERLNNKTKDGAQSFELLKCLGATITFVHMQKTKNVQVVTHRVHASLQRAPQVLETQRHHGLNCATHILGNTFMNTNTNDVNHSGRSLRTAHINIQYCAAPAFQLLPGMSGGVQHPFYMCQHMLRMHPILMHRHTCDCNTQHVPTNQHEQMLVDCNVKFVSAPVNPFPRKWVD